MSFKVVLFNTHSSDEEVKANERYRAMNYVLKSVCEETTNDLFMLCQDNVILKKHKLICHSFDVDSNDIPRNAEACAYYKNSGNDGTEHFNVEYPDRSYLTRLNDAMPLNPNSNFSIYRLTAVIITQRSNKNDKLLLVSWHGHYKKPDDDKRVDFERLVTILDRFKEQTGCTVVIVGGDFNMTADYAKQSNALRQRNGVVLDDYKQTLHNEDAEEDAPLEKKPKFSKELRCMMYGFGDDQNPYTESVDLLEDIVIKYITEMTKNAMEVGRPGHISVEDIIFLIRKDPKKYSRVKELLLMNEELKKARKAFEFDDIKYATTK